MSTATFTSSGTKAQTQVKLPKDIFGLEVTDHQLLKEAYVAYLANGRLAAATTKTRGLVSGGGRKPWSQKGTGRARFGSSRNPIWRGGGVVFGPDGTENYTRKMPQKAKRLALKQALSLSVQHKNVIVIDDFAPKAAKTKSAAELLAKIGTPTRTLIVLETVNDDVRRSTKNLQEVVVVSARGLSVYDTLNANNIVFTKSGLSALEARLSGGAA